MKEFFVTGGNTSANFIHIIIDEIERDIEVYFGINLEYLHNNTILRTTTPRLTSLASNGCNGAPSC